MKLLIKFKWNIIQFNKNKKQVWIPLLYKATESGLASLEWTEFTEVWDHEQVTTGIQLVSFWPDQLPFSVARELKDKLTLWVLLSNTTDPSGMMGLASSDCRFESGRRDEINSIAPESRENPSRLAMLCLKQSNINGCLWQHRRSVVMV